ncbi:MAG: hypothetical protein WCZ89_04590 [Phycisphaerae bacterium]
MFNYSRLKSAVKIYVFIFCVFAGVLNASGLPQTARLLPPETMFLVDIADFSGFMAQFERTDVYKFYKDPVMSAFFEQAKQQWNKKISGMDQNNIIKTLAETGLLPQKRAALAIVSKETQKPKQELPAILITEWGQDNIGKIKEVLDEMMKKNLEMGGRNKTTEDFHGVTIEVALDEGENEFSYCFIDDCLIVSLDLEVLKFAVAHVKGASIPTLAEEVHFQDVFQGTGPDRDAFVFVNIKQFISNLRAKDKTGMSETSIKALGFENVSGLGFSAAVGKNPQNWCSGKALLRVNGAKQGVCKIFDSPARTVAIPEFIPTSAYSINIINLDAKNVFAEISNTLTSFSPMFAAFLYRPIIPAGPEGEPALMLKEDIIEHLGSQIIFSQGVKKPFTADTSSAEYLGAIATNNRNALEKSLAAMHSRTIQGEDPQAKRDLLGYTIYVIKTGSMPIFGSAASPMQSQRPGQPESVMPNMAFTITNTHLIFGLESSVEQAVRTLSGGDSVRNSEWFNTGRGSLPSSVLIAAVENHRMSGEYLWWVLKQLGDTSQKQNVKELDLGTASKLSEEGLNFSLLPEFEQVKKYFGLVVSHLISREDGFFMEFKTVNLPSD